jgi:hypothetical protein
MDPISEILLIIEIAAKAEPIVVTGVTDGVALLKAWRSSGTDPTPEEIAALRTSVQALISTGDSLMPKQ